VTASLPFPLDTSIDIPILIGSTAQSVEYWPGPRDLSKWTWNNYNKYVTTSLDSFGPRLTQMALQQYPPSQSSTPSVEYLTMVSDLRQTCPVNLIASNLSSQLVSPVFRYLVESKPSKPITLYDFESNHSFHYWDLIGFFGTIEQLIVKPSESDEQFKERIREIVFNFVKDGKPNPVIGFSSTEWSQSFPHEMAVIGTNQTLIINHYVISDRCELWDRQGLTKYVWIS